MDIATTGSFGSAECTRLIVIAWCLSGMPSIDDVPIDRNVFSILRFYIALRFGSKLHFGAMESTFSYIERLYVLLVITMCAHQFRCARPSAGCYDKNINVTALFHWFALAE